MGRVLWRLTFETSPKLGRYVAVWPRVKFPTESSRRNVTYAKISDDVWVNLRLCVLIFPLYQMAPTALLPRIPDDKGWTPRRHNGFVKAMWALTHFRVNEITFLLSCFRLLCAWTRFFMLLAVCSLHNPFQPIAFFSHYFAFICIANGVFSSQFFTYFWLPVFDFANPGLDSGLHSLIATM